MPLPARSCWLMRFAAQSLQRFSQDLKNQAVRDLDVHQYSIGDELLDGPVCRESLWLCQTNESHFSCHSMKKSWVSTRSCQVRDCDLCAVWDNTAALAVLAFMSCGIAMKQGTNGQMMTTATFACHGQADGAKYSCRLGLARAAAEKQACPNPIVAKLEQDLWQARGNAAKQVCCTPIKICLSFYCLLIRCRQQMSSLASLCQCSAF